ncbi:25798_t:CDS:2, partial [Gigaspora margarita]
NIREIAVSGRESVREMVVKKVIDLKKSGCVEEVIVSEGIGCKEVTLSGMNISRK